ncbi:DUF3159 domain-containing protein [Microlunatus elymi]|uniref:DUF3159 domain-containing protein n=1 Tax=Microlunatus elymi TaxID=2596828 RepID=A0A516PZJ8_9ACTN|nr:DUF3159 domain-containing protein [Microlunatus elymi]QDP96594.1 DUF3159 domain-containing protein [Microlunatus elymi]
MTGETSSSGEVPADREDLHQRLQQYDYVEQYVRAELSRTLGGARGMIEGALPFVGFTVAWMITSRLSWSLGVAVAVALVLAAIRLIQKQSLRYVAQAVVPTAIAAVIAARTGRAQDAFLPGILYNGLLAVISIITIAIGKPLVGFILGAAMGDPTGWSKDRGLVKMMTKLTAVLAVPYLLRFVIQLPIYLTDHVVLLGVAKLVLGWPLLALALVIMGVMLSRGRTPIDRLS